MTADSAILFYYMFLLAENRILCSLLFTAAGLKAYQQISKKGCFEKYCSCDKACPFSAVYGTARWSNSENLTIDKYINKRVRLFIPQTCV